MSFLLIFYDPSHLNMEVFLYSVFSLQQQRRPTVDRITNGTRVANLVKTSRHGNDDDLSAQEIVSQFAIKSGLTLDDVVTNYAKYADEIIRSFVTKGASRGQPRCWFADSLDFLLMFQNILRIKCLVAMIIRLFISIKTV